MDKKEKLELLEEVLDVDCDSIDETTVLADLEEWDSVAILSLIIMFEEKFDKKVSAQDAKAYNTVNDILEMMI